MYVNKPARSIMARLLFAPNDFSSAGSTRTAEKRERRGRGERGKGVCVRTVPYEGTNF